MEAALKLKEVAGIHAEAVSAAELLHELSTKERAMLPLRRMETLQKFVSVHANVPNHFNLECPIVDRKTFKERREAALAEWLQIADLTAKIEDRAPSGERGSL